MAAAAVTSVEEVISRMGGSPFLAEVKYDGERCQLHWVPASPQAAGDGGAAAGAVRIFARSMDEMTARFPDVADALAAAMPPGAPAAVLDAEVCAYDRAAARPLPFQTLAARPRKAPTAEQQAALPVCIYVFDVLSANGASLLHKPLPARRAALRALLTPVAGRVELAQGEEGSTAEELEAALVAAAEMEAEGLMVKSLADDAESGYAPGKRSFAWLKLKRDYIDGLADSFDLVPVGAYAGTGKRSGGYGAFLLACRVAAPGAARYQPVCKVGTGFSDDDLATFSALFERGGAAAPRGDGGPPTWLDLPASLPPHYEPDYWLATPAPPAVWEVRAAALSLSPTFLAAAGLLPEEPAKGLALRFPRFVRARPDKAPGQATSGAELAEAFRAQPEFASLRAEG